MANNQDTTINIASLLTERRIDQVFETLNQFADPNQFLKSKGGSKITGAMLRDDAIFGALETRMDAATSLNRIFDGEDQAITEFIQQAIGRDCLEEIVLGVMRAIPYGFNVTELVYAEEADRIVLSEALNKPLERYGVSRKGVVLERTDAFRMQEAPFAKYVLSRHRATYECPTGNGVLSRLYYAHMFRCHGWEFYVKFLEKFGHPIIVGQMEGKKEDLVKFARSLQSSNRPNAIVTDPDTNIEILQAGNAGDNFKCFLGMIDNRIYKTILGQTLTSSNEGGGSNALGQVHNLVREDKRRSDIRMIERAVNDVIRFLGILNDIDSARLPRFFLEDEKTLNLERANRDQVLHNIGVRFNENYYEQHYDLPSTDFSVSSDASTGGLLFKDGTCKHGNLKFTETPQQRVLDSLAEDASDESELALDFDEVAAIIRNATNRRDLEVRLSTLLGRRDEAFVDQLTNAQYQAQVLGFVDGHREVDADRNTSES